MTESSVLRWTGWSCGVRSRLPERRMFDHLDIYDPRERWLVGAADLGLSVLSAPFRALRRQRTEPPRRILLLRLERIGDLLMSVGAIAAVRRLAPDAEIDLVVGSWNAEIARLLPSVTRV